MKFSKGLYAASLVAFTLQLLVFLFKYVVESISIADFAIDNWAGVLGYSMLLILFILKRTMSTDIILTVIGVLLWVVQILMVLTSSDPLIGFAVSGLGILGVILSAFALVFEIKVSKSENKNK